MLRKVLEIKGTNHLTRQQRVIKILSKLPVISWLNTYLDDCGTKNISVLALYLSAWAFIASLSENCLSSFFDELKKEDFVIWQSSSFEIITLHYIDMVLNPTEVSSACLEIKVIGMVQLYMYAAHVYLLTWLLLFPKNYLEKLFATAAYFSTFS